MFCDTRSINFLRSLKILFFPQPESYLSQLIGHESKGSILSELKNRGWSSSVMVGHYKLARGFGTFNVSIELTEDGLNNIDEIIKIFFQVRFFFPRIFTLES